MLIRMCVCLYIHIFKRSFCYFIHLYILVCMSVWIYIKMLTLKFTCERDMLAENGVEAKKNSFWLNEWRFEWVTVGFARFQISKNMCTYINHQLCCGDMRRVGKPLGKVNLCACLCYSSFSNWICPTIAVNIPYTYTYIKQQ